MSNVRTYSSTVFFAMRLLFSCEVGINVLYLHLGEFLNPIKMVYTKNYCYFFVELIILEVHDIFCH